MDSGFDCLINSLHFALTRFPDSFFLKLISLQALEMLIKSREINKHEKCPENPYK